MELRRPPQLKVVAVHPAAEVPGDTFPALTAVGNSVVAKIEAGGHLFGTLCIEVCQLGGAVHWTDASG